MDVIKNGNDIIIKNIECFDLGLSVDCGQAFRWYPLEDGSWSGVVKGKELRVKQDDNGIVFYNTSEEDFNSVWRVYFDLDRDYKAIISSYNEENLRTACREYEGIRILKQDEWEAVCSFIISANNNIPRIKGIIERFCNAFGEKTGDRYSFPCPETVAELTVEDLAVIRSGFRAKYIIDAAQKISSGQVDLASVGSMEFSEAKAELLKIKGVGEKVAQCSLLYGFGRLEAFPVDVWVNRIISELYPSGLPECIRGSEGIAQQYLFHWRRNLE